jgi:hypothetical protein
MRRVMIDIEALGQGDDALIIQIGAADFDCTKTFKRTLDPRDCEKNGATLNADTVMWWMKQSDEARESISKVDSLEIPAFTDLNDFLADADEIWSHATYDFVTIMGAFRRLKIKPKFGFRQARDIRTLMALSPQPDSVLNALRAGTHHDALADAQYQIGYCYDALERLGKF